MDAAIEDYRKSIELNGDAPGNLVLWKEVIRLLLEVKRDLPAASDAIEQARLQAPADRGLLYLQAHLHLRLGSLREAAAAYATLLEGDASDPDLRTEGACALAEVGRITDAYGWLDPSATGTAWDAVLGAYLLRVLGREEEARAVARERLEAARGNESPFPAGYLAAVLAQNDEASAQLARPNGEEFGRGLVARADAYLLSGVREAAEKCLVQALAQCLSGGDLSLMPLTAALRSCDDWVAVQLWQEVLAEQTQGRLADVRALLDAHLAKEPGSEAWKKLHTAIAK